MSILLALAAAAGPAAPPTPDVVVTASRVPLAIDRTAASVTLIDRDEIDAIGLSLGVDFARLVPGVSVATTGPRGSQTQLRIRGAEANHSLLFVDGIRFNDPAAGNEARFELLTADTLSRIEVLRGPQSALWGSEALGGVIAAETPLAGTRSLVASGEHGGLDTSRASLRAGTTGNGFSLSATAAYLRSDGIDSFGAGGERDGFETRHASVKAVYRPPAAGGEIGLVAHRLTSGVDFDGTDPLTFLRADTLDRTRNRLSAVRGWASLARGGTSAMVEGSYLASSNRNRLGADPLNRTAGDRMTLGGQLVQRLGDHDLIAAVDHEAESFRARDTAFFGGTDQDRARSLTAFIGEWRARWSDALATDVAVRHDRFSAFRDATTLRASAVLGLAADLSAHASYGEGIAQPTFYDLFGFFPGSFVGNPALKPERSRGIEAGLRWTPAGISVAVAGFDNRLRDEIVDVFDPTTFLSTTDNATGRSRRRGVEAEAGWTIGPVAVRASYTFLDSQERRVAGAALVKEVRRPRHSASLWAHGSSGPVTLGAALAYVGARTDVDFDSFPAARVRLSDYVLGSVQGAWRLSPAFEAFARVENLFDADYRDVVGYATEGRTVHAGVRLRLGT